MVCFTLDIYNYALNRKKLYILMQLILINILTLNIMDKIKNPVLPFPPLFYEWQFPLMHTKHKYGALSEHEKLLQFSYSKFTFHLNKRAIISMHEG